MSDKIITEEIALCALQAFVEKGEIHSDNLALIVPAMKRAINTILPDVGEAFARIAESVHSDGWVQSKSAKKWGLRVADAIRAAAKG